VTPHILAVREDHHRLASGLAAQQVDAGGDDVVERGVAPRRETLDCLDALDGIGRLPRQRKDGVVEPQQRDAIGGRHGRQELFDGALHLGHRLAHAAADVDSEHEIERDVFRREMRDRLRTAVLVDTERPLWQPHHVLAPAIGHGHRDFDEVDID
jgi:hypothetical protein